MLDRAGRGDRRPSALAREHLRSLANTREHPRATRATLHFNITLSNIDIKYILYLNNTIMFMD